MSCYISHCGRVTADSASMWEIFREWCSYLCWKLLTKMDRYEDERR